MKVGAVAASARNGALDLVKWLAMLSMLLDHLRLLWPELHSLFIPGRLAFPLFCLAIAANVARARTGQLVSESNARYLGYMLVYALIAEVVYRPISPLGTLNVMFTLVLGLAKLQHAMELLPIIGTLASTWALFRCSGLTVRCVMWCSTACWVIHNAWLGSIGGTLIEGSFLLMNGLNIIRFWRMQRKGIDPFKVEKKVQEENPSA